jgi:hypothetical protein
MSGPIVSRDIFHMLMAHHLSPKETKNFALTCKVLNIFFQHAPDKVWEWICHRTFTCLPSSCRNYKQYFYYNSTGRLEDNLGRLVCRYAIQVASFSKVTCMSATKDILSCGYDDGIVRFFQTWTKGWLFEKSFHSQIECMHIFGEKELLIGLHNGHIKLWGINDRQEIGTFPKKHKGSICCLDRNERIIVSGSTDGTIKGWNSSNYTYLFSIDIENNVIVKHIKINNELIVSKLDKFEDEGKLFVVNSSVEILDLATREWLHTVRLRGPFNEFAMEGEKVMIGYRDFECYSINELKEINSAGDAYVPNVGGATCLYSTPQLFITGNFGPLDPSVMDAFVPYIEIWKWMTWETHILHCAEKITCVCANETMIFAGDVMGRILAWGIGPEIQVHHTKEQEKTRKLDNL